MKTAFIPFMNDKRGAAVALAIGAATLLSASPAARADLLPGPRPAPVAAQQPNRDPVALARRDAGVAKLLEQARGPGKSGPEETAVNVPLGGVCGFAGCSSSSLVVFTFKSKGANTLTRTVLALVECGPVGDSCKVAPAEVRALPTSGPASPGGKAK